MKMFAVLSTLTVLMCATPALACEYRGPKPAPAPDLAAGCVGMLATLGAFGATRIKSRSKG
jgi:hypothetical protein